MIRQDGAPLARARTVLKDVFGYDSFRPGQEEIVAAVLAGQDVFAVMPTGSGKSICYQLPAVADGALTVVVSPLIALMRDQVQQLAALGVAAATLNSAQGDEERRDALERLERGALHLLFVSPERLAAGGLAGRLRRAGARRLAIDEAHCVSQWGHDFRPEYRQLARIRGELGDVQVLAFTATADGATRADIAAQLFPSPPRTVLHSFDRPNLSLRFEPKNRPTRQIADFLAGRSGQSGIVYCSSRSGAERLAAALARSGRRALAYHAGLDPALRAERQDAFLQEDGIVMAATVAFGMGINKPDVRFVVHADMPPSVESYYQEIGRAGRDGLPAETLTLFGLDDMVLRRRQIDEKEGGEERRGIDHRRLGAMIGLCEAASCRRQALLAYFGEASEPCGRCDLCRDAAPARDRTEDAQKVLSAVARTGQRFGAAYLAQILVGEASEAVRRNGHDAIRTFGVGRDRDRPAWQALVRQLFAAGALAEASETHGGFRLTERGEAILFGREPIALREARAVPAGRGARTRRIEGAERSHGLDEEGSRVFEALRAVRLRLAREQGVAAFIVLPDRSLLEMATRRPATLAALRGIPGFGEAKLARYGEAFLQAIAAS